MSFKNYLRAILFAAVCVPLIAVVCLLLWNITIVNHNQDLSRQLAAEMVGREIQARLEMSRALVEAAANKLSVEDSQDSEYLNGFLKDTAAKLPYIRNLHFDNTEGKTIAYYPEFNKWGKTNVGVDHTDRSHWQRIKNHKLRLVSDVIKAVGSDDIPIVNITIPARDRSGNVLGYAVSALNINKLVDNITTRIAPGEFDVWVFDSQGVPLYSNIQDSEPGPSLTKNEINEVIQGGGKWTTFRQTDDSELIGYLLPLQKYEWAVGVFRRAQDQSNEKSSEYLANIILFCLICVLTLVVAAVGFYSLTSKLNTLMRTVFNSTIGVKVPILTVPKEFGDLQRAFDRMRRQMNLTPVQLQAQADERNNREKPSGFDYQAQGFAVTNIFESLSRGLILVDENSSVRFFNRKAKELIPGIQDGDDVLKQLSEVFVSPIPVTHWLIQREILLTNKLTGQEIVMTRSDMSSQDEIRQVFIFRLYDEDSPSKSSESV